MKYIMVGVNVSLLLLKVTWTGNLARTVLIALIGVEKPIRLSLAPSGSKWDLKRTWQKEGHLVFHSLAYLPAFELLLILQLIVGPEFPNFHYGLATTFGLKSETMEAMCHVDWINTGCHPLSDERQLPWIPNLDCLGTHSQGLVSQLSGVIPLLLLF